jgi:hypothetical protein
VSGRAVDLIRADQPKAGNQIIIGSVGKSKLIDQLIKERKIDVSVLKGKWEQFLIQ